MLSCTEKALALSVLISIIPHVSPLLANTGEESEKEVPISNVTGKKLVRIAQELIYHGDIQKIPTLVKGWQESGLDGVCICFTQSEPQENKIQHTAFRWWDVEPRSYEEFAAEINALKSVKDWGRLTDNFVWTASHVIGKKVPDWFSDEDWAVVLENTRLVARITKEIGFKGIVFDAEGYGGATYGVWRQPWNYPLYATADYTIKGESEPRSHADVAAQVRKRGKQWAEALTEVYPEIVVFVLPGLYEVTWQECLRKGEPVSKTESGLWVSFIDGMIDGLGPKTLLVDANEATYLDSTYSDMLIQRDHALNQALMLSADPVKARQKISYATGLWTDAGYGATGRFSNTDGNKNQRTPEVHKHAVHNALASSDHYAWQWGEWGGDGSSNWLPESPTAVIKDYWKANDLGHLPQDLNWEVVPVGDAKDYSEDDKKAAIKDRQFWGSVKSKHMTVLLESLGDWRFRFDPEMKVRYAPWTSPGYNDESWFSFSTDKCWQSQGVRANGPGIYRVTFDVPADLEGKMEAIYLAFGGLGQGEGHVYMNGQWVAVAQDFVDVTKIVKFGESNQVSIVFLNKGGPGGLTGQVKLVGKR